jgi:hypothetical protein
VLCDVQVLRERAREHVERGADDLTSLMFVDIDAPSARNGDGPGGDNGS